jgi:hypothetical protein
MRRSLAHHTFEGLPKLEMLAAPTPPQSTVTF